MVCLRNFIVTDILDSFNTPDQPTRWIIALPPTLETDKELDITKCLVYLNVIYYGECNDPQRAQ